MTDGNDAERHKNWRQVVKINPIYPLKTADEWIKRRGRSRHVTDLIKLMIVWELLMILYSGEIQTIPLFLLCLHLSVLLSEDLSSLHGGGLTLAGK